ILDDVFLAFMKATNYKAKRELGPLARPEKLVNGGSAGYTFSSKQRADQGIFDIAGKRRAKVSVIDWAPHAAFRDFSIGHLVGWEDEGEMFLDRVESIEVIDTREDRVLVDTVIGDDEPEKSPQQRNQERFKRLFSMLNAMTLATN
ncbi:Gp37-like protein, partial [Rhodococcus sp. Leaf278]|uniref:Gp37-like protein n=1 Tax=Rhodococcus sp. Leaf278 TaxID=1736319 RepID=UPI003FA7C65C